MDLTDILLNEKLHVRADAFMTTCTQKTHSSTLTYNQMMDTLSKTVVSSTAFPPGQQCLLVVTNVLNEYKKCNVLIDSD